MPWRLYLLGNSFNANIERYTSVRMVYSLKTIVQEPERFALKMYLFLVSLKSNLSVDAWHNESRFSKSFIERQMDEISVLRCCT